MLFNALDLSTLCSIKRLGDHFNHLTTQVIGNHDTLIQRGRGFDFCFVISFADTYYCMKLTDERDFKLFH